MPRLLASALLLATHAEGVKRGRHPEPSTSPVGELIHAACAALGTRGRPLSRTALAERMGLVGGSRALLTPSMLATRGLSQERRDMLHTWIAEARKGKVSA